MEKFTKLISIMFENIILEEKPKESITVIAATTLFAACILHKMFLKVIKHKLYAKADINIATL